jgi:hypothetical protein
MTWHLFGCNIVLRSGNMSWMFSKHEILLNVIMGFLFLNRFRNLENRKLLTMEYFMACMEDCQSTSVA